MHDKISTDRGLNGDASELHTVLFQKFIYICIFRLLPRELMQLLQAVQVSVVVFLDKHT